MPGKSVGAFIIWWNKGGESIIDSIFLGPEYHNKNIEREAWNFIEENFPTKTWKLNTPT